MYDLNKAYPEKWFASRKSLVWRAPIVVDALMDILKPKSVLDVGCGNGDLIAEFLRRDILAFGLEGTKNTYHESALPMKDLHRITLWDIRNPVPKMALHFRYDLVICLEVAEHIEEEYSDILVENLCSLSDRILFTAATPGQGGHYHVNCQKFEYWWYKFSARDCYHRRHVVERIQEKWEPYKHKKGIKAFYQNLMYFERMGVL